MSCNVGPNEVVSGLVLSVDMNNTQKSWIGTPVSNQVTNSDNLASSRTNPANCGLSFTDFSSGGPTNGSFVRITRVTTTGVTSDWAYNFTYSITTGNKFTFSCYARCVDGTTATIGFSNPDMEGVSFNLTPQWQRFSAQFTSNIQGIQWFRINRSNAATNTIGCTYDLAMAQLEDSPFVTPYMSSGATAASRTATQAIVDLTKNTSITAFNLTYNTDASFSFNGSTSYLVTPATAVSTLNPDALTVEAWVYHYSFGPAGQSGRAYINNWSSFNTADQRGFILRTYAYQQNPSFWWCWGPGANTYYTLVSSVTLKTYTWYHIVGTFEKNVAAKIYVNGVLTGTQSGAPYIGNSLVYDTTNGIHIGKSPINASWMDGKIGVSNLYNRTLSATEIMQNYNSLKSRYTNDLITSGLVVNFNATDTNSYPGSGTTWYSFGGYGPNATFNSTPTFATGNDANFTFDGVKYATISNAAGFMPTTAITFNCWVKPTALGAYHKIFTVVTPGTNSINGIYVSVGPSPYQTYFGVITTVTQLAAIYTTDMSTMEYTNLCGTYNGTTIILYINGVSVATQALTGTMKNFGVARISGYDDNTEGFVGNISQIQIYDRALSATEVLQNYNATRGAYLPNIVANVKLSLDAGNTSSYPGTGTTWYDLSGYGINGTLTNSPTYSSANSGYLVFDGVNNYVNLGNAIVGNFGTSNFTLEVVFKVITSANSVCLFAKSTGDNPRVDYGWLLNLSNSGTEIGFATASAAVAWGASGSYSIKTSGSNITAALPANNTWQVCHLVADRTLTDVKIYVNGVLQTLQPYVGSGGFSTVGSISNTQNLVVGAESDNLWINANISVARIYSKALSAAEVTQNFNVVRWRYGI